MIMEPLLGEGLESLLAGGPFASNVREEFCVSGLVISVQGVACLLISEVLGNESGEGVKLGLATGAGSVDSGEETFVLVVHGGVLDVIGGAPLEGVGIAHGCA